MFIACWSSVVLRKASDCEGVGSTLMASCWVWHEQSKDCSVDTGDALPPGAQIWGSGSLSSVSDARPEGWRAVLVSYRSLEALRRRSFEIFGFRA